MKRKVQMDQSVWVLTLFFLEKKMLWNGNRHSLNSDLPIKKKISHNCLLCFSCFFFWNFTISCVLQPSYWEAFHGDFQFQWQYLQLVNVQVPQFSASNLGQICTYKNCTNLSQSFSSRRRCRTQPCFKNQLSMPVDLEFSGWLNRFLVTLNVCCLLWLMMIKMIWSKSGCHVLTSLLLQLCWGWWIEKS